MFKRKHHVTLVTTPIKIQGGCFELITAYFEYKVDAKTFINNLMYCIEKKGAITLDDVYESANMIRTFPHKFEWKHPVCLKKEELEAGELLPRCLRVSLPPIECKEEETNE